MFKAGGLKNSFDDEACTLLDKDASFEGKLTFEGTVQIFGAFKGEIFSTGSLVIGETANVEGRIEVGVLQISGKVRGELLAKERLELLAKSQVFGNIITSALVVEQGAKFQGNCEMGMENQPRDFQESQPSAYLGSLSSTPRGAMVNPMEEIELFQ